MSDEVNSTTASGTSRGSSTADIKDTEIRAPEDVAADRAASTVVLADDVLDGRYRLQKLVARRGPVALWRGDDLVLARPVAVRVLAHADSESSAGRLIAAAVRSGRLVHAGAASTYDATTTDTPAGTVAYVVSEWVDGTTLTGLLEEGPLSAERTIRVVLAVARVLAAAHARDVSHGDLHPGDVVLTPHGGVKVLDLEVRAALTDEVAEAPPAERQARDVRALGALLYACLTGRWPLAGDRGLPPAPTTSDGSLYSPRQVRAGVSRDLDHLALTALGVDTTDGTIDTAVEMVEALESVPVASYVGDRLDDRTYDAAYQDSYSTGGPEGTTLIDAPTGNRLPAPRRRFLRPRIVVPLVLLVICGVLAWLLGVMVGRVGGPSDKPPALSPSNGQPGPALSLTSVRSFDPQGDGAEQDSTVPYSHDGNPSTAWTSDTYRTANFGNLKTGVGLKVDFGRPEKVSSVRLSFAEPGTTVELRGGDVDASGIDAYPVAARVPTGGKDVDLKPTDGAAHRFWVVWVTQLPQTARGFRAELDEMVFQS